jgi:plasmid stabilization system protein ParE
MAEGLHFVSKLCDPCYVATEFAESDAERQARMLAEARNPDESRAGRLN